MKCFVEVNARQNLQKLCESNADVLVFGLHGFCGDRLMSVSIDELNDIIHQIHASNKQACLFFPYIILQTQFKERESILTQCAQAPLDFIASGDVGLGFFLKQNNTGAKLIFMNETMIASPMDAQTFLDTGYDVISPAVDITLEKKKSFAKQMPKQVIFQLCGTHLISTSKRPLLSSYYDVINTPHAPKHVKMRELSRESRYFGVEDDQGFHVFHDALLVLDDPIFFLCEYGYLSSLFVSIEETLHWIELIKQNNFSIDNVRMYSQFNVYAGLEETDKGLEAGT
jgi:collagenase-like PrtC family protease